MSVAVSALSPTLSGAMPLRKIGFWLMGAFLSAEELWWLPASSCRGALREETLHGEANVTRCPGFSIATGSITMLVLNPQHAMACPGNDGR